MTADYVRPRYVQNLATKTMHYAPDGYQIACGRRLLSWSSVLGVYGIQTWCRKCHAALIDGLVSDAS